jgi:hyperosmotically inducible periplasmic protein
MTIAPLRARIQETLVTRTGIHLVVVLALATLHLTTTGVAATTREATRDAQSRKDDTLLTARVKGALITDAMTRAHRITIETFQGIIQLSGVVSSAAEKLRAGQLAAAVPGVIEVRNAIQVRQMLADSGAKQRDTRRVARTITNEPAGDDHQVERQ